jgi:hypothetical protein
VTNTLAYNDIELISSIKDNILFASCSIPGTVDVRLESYRSEKVGAR